MDGWLYEKVNNIEQMLILLLNELEANKKKEEKPETKK